MVDATADDRGRGDDFRAELIFCDQLESLRVGSEDRGVAGFVGRVDQVAYHDGRTTEGASQAGFPDGCTGIRLQAHGDTRVCHGVQIAFGDEHGRNVDAQIVRPLDLARAIGADR